MTWWKIESRNESKQYSENANCLCFQYCNTWDPESFTNYFGGCEFSTQTIQFFIAQQPQHLDNFSQGQSPSKEFTRKELRDSNSPKIQLDINESSSYTFSLSKIVAPQSTIKCSTKWNVQFIFGNNRFPTVSKWGDCRLLLNQNGESSFFLEPRPKGM